MRPDHDIILSSFSNIEPELKIISEKIEKNLKDIFIDVDHIDKISSRPKSRKSFSDKIEKLNEKNELKYKEPIKEIQDLVGARIVVFYKNDIDTIKQKINKFFQSVEEKYFTPDDPKRFDYEGVHFICFIDSSIYSAPKNNPLIPNFFELQIKTLYQHAWAQSNHGLGYKPEIEKLSPDVERKLAFIAAQSWGADIILEQLVQANVGN